MFRIISYCLLLFSLKTQAQTQLPIPDTLVGPNYVLNIHKDSVQFFSGDISHTYSFNQYKYLGPTLIFNKGNNVSITVNNQLDDTTTIHWHGIHLPSKWDGGPHTLIMPATNWTPQFTVMDNAATYWYHPHLHMKTAEQAIKGAVGLIIVRDSIEAALTLPRNYGIDDFPLIVQCQQYDSSNQAMPLGMQDSTILINGARSNYGNSVFVNAPAQIVRMRILNASGERSFNFGLTANKSFEMIASDGGLLDSPINLTRLRLGPGERAEILVNLNGMLGQSLYLMSYASELSMGIQGGPTMPMPGGPPMDSPLNGIDFNLMQINVITQTATPVVTIPSALTTNYVYLPSNANITRTIRFTADSAMVMDGPFYFNDSSFNMMRIDYEIPMNNIEIWKLVNETMVAHPFHIHDVQFYLIDRNGNPPNAEEIGRKDVVLVPSGDSVMFITKFEDFADTIIPFMYHCHILMHEDAGMMGQFIIKPVTTGINNLIFESGYSIYPNPTTNKIYIKSISFENYTLNIYNTYGQILYSNLENGNTDINISNYPVGIYYIQLTSGINKITKRIVKNN